MGIGSRTTGEGDKWRRTPGAGGAGGVFPALEGLEVQSAGAGVARLLTGALLSFPSGGGGVDAESMGGIGVAGQSTTANRFNVDVCTRLPSSGVNTISDDFRLFFFFESVNGVGVTTGTSVFLFE